KGSNGAVDFTLSPCGRGWFASAASKPGEGNAANSISPHPAFGHPLPQGERVRNIAHSHSGAAVPRLIVLRGVDEGKQFDLSGPAITVGRHSSNSVALHDTQVSRRHLE